MGLHSQICCAPIRQLRQLAPFLTLQGRAHITASVVARLASCLSPRPLRARCLADSLIPSQRAVAWTYVKGWFLVDLVSGIPFSLIIRCILHVSTSSPRIFTFEQGFRLCAFLRQVRCAMAYVFRRVVQEHDSTYTLPYKTRSYTLHLTL